MAEYMNDVDTTVRSVSSLQSVHTATASVKKLLDTGPSTGSSSRIIDWGVQWSTVLYVHSPISKLGDTDNA